MQERAIGVPIPAAAVAPHALRVSTWAMATDLPQGAFLSALPRPELDRILGGARERRFRRGDIVFHEGDPGDTLHAVAAGRFGVQTGTADGDRVMLQIVTGG